MSLDYTNDVRELVAAVKAGDRSTFSTLVERHRRELQLHCYRMLGSFDESEDLVQETFLRAWRRRSTFEGRAPVRAWLYRIATNACLDSLSRRPRQISADKSSFEVPWLQPYPDELLEGIQSDEAAPDDAVVAKETVELAFMVAIQHLPPRSRAVLILRDVLGWPARDTAELLESSVASVNSALQRARSALKQHLPERRVDWAPGTDATEAQRDLVRRYIEASEQADGQALLELMHEDARFAMPPEPETWLGRETIVGAWIEGGFGGEEWGDILCLPASANRQPAVACYRRRPGETEYEPFAVDVLRIELGAVAEIITFGADQFPALGLPQRP